MVGEEDFVNMAIFCFACRIYVVYKIINILKLWINSVCIKKLVLLLRISHFWLLEVVKIFNPNLFIATDTPE
jgi:hypothetical protein